MGPAPRLRHRPRDPGRFRRAAKVDTGSLYPALHRLERQGWIAAEWKTSENKQRVRVYRLTASGKRQLLAQRSWWEQLSGAIASILAPQPERGEP